jgi:lysozyme family protein
MTQDFEPAFMALMGNEGGFVDDPQDPGGATRWGVTQRMAAKYGYDGDMREYPIEKAKEVAFAEFWHPVRGDELPSEVAFQVFDAAYNSGVERAIKWLQQAVGVPVDGIFGTGTMGAVTGGDPSKIVMRFNVFRLKFLTSLPTWEHFGKGWANRIAENLLRAAG